jgi:hypothetical protein
MASSPVLRNQSGFGLVYTVRGRQINFSAHGGKLVKLALVSDAQSGNFAMADFTTKRLNQLPLLQPLVLRTFI